MKLVSLKMLHCWFLILKYVKTIYYFQYSLGRSCKAPCYVLKFKQATVMMDCSLDLTPALNFTPLQLVEK